MLKGAFYVAAFIYSHMTLNMWKLERTCEFSNVVWHFRNSIENILIILKYFQIYFMLLHDPYWLGTASLLIDIINTENIVKKFMSWYLW